jgi:hypothetical protein
LQTLEIPLRLAKPRLPLSIWHAESRLTPPFSETWPVFTAFCVADDPPPTPLPFSILFLQKGRLTSAVAVFDADSSRTPGCPAPVGCRDCNRRGAQLAPTHPGSASPCFSAQGSPRLPVTQYSSVRSCRYSPSSQDKCCAAGSRRGYCQRRLRPGRTSFRWLPPGSFDPLPLV